MSERCAFLAMRQKFTGNGRMRALAYAVRCIVRADIRKQKEHEQGATTAFDVRSPLHEIRVLGAEAHVDVPAMVADVLVRPEADRESSKPVRREPATFADETVVGGMELRRIGGGDEGRRRLGAYAEDRLRKSLGPGLGQTDIGP
ncbi:hypothetical protein [Oceaniovalibus sp. ACAM 378]|uniref:hypothetical protein n=1 Tax=Oceaniovalibus sp. ACAM 378 TaxID=2599923 RepID=UPI001651DA9E|nr:hypothetical protein [Oceaniovalibus sp. ACAM 378]